MTGAGVGHDLSCPAGADAAVGFQDVPDAQRLSDSVAAAQDVSEIHSSPVQQLQDFPLPTGQVLRALPEGPGCPGAELRDDGTALRLLVSPLATGMCRSARTS